MWQSFRTWKIIRLIFALRFDLWILSAFYIRFIGHTGPCSYVVSTLDSENTRGKMNLISSIENLFIGRRTCLSFLVCKNPLFQLTCHRRWNYDWMDGSNEDENKVNVIFLTSFLSNVWPQYDDCMCHDKFLFGTKKFCPLWKAWLGCAITAGQSRNANKTDVQKKKIRKSERYNNVIMSNYWNQSH